MERAVTRLEEGFSGSYVVDGAKILLPKLTVVGIPSYYMSEDEIKIPFCENMNNSINWFNQVKRQGL